MSASAEDDEYLHHWPVVVNPASMEVQIDRACKRISKLATQAYQTRHAKNVDEHQRFLALVALGLEEMRILEAVTRLRKEINKAKAEQGTAQSSTEESGDRIDVSGPNFGLSMHLAKIGLYILIGAGVVTYLFALVSGF